MTLPILAITLALCLPLLAARPAGAQPSASASAVSEGAGSVRRAGSSSGPA